MNEPNKTKNKTENPAKNESNREIAIVSDRHEIAFLYTIAYSHGITIKPTNTIANNFVLAIVFLFHFINACVYLSICRFYAGCVFFFFSFLF